MEDFINFAPTTCKRKMLEYQRTGDPQLFHILLARYDRYILTVIYGLQRKVFTLRNEPLQELYHVGILGFVKGILAMKETTDAKYICNHLKAYILSELKQTYLPNHPEPNASEYIMNTSTHTSPNETYRKVSAHMLMESEVLTEKERKLLDMYYFQGLTMRDISKKIKTSLFTTHKRLEIIRNKLKNLLNN